MASMDRETLLERLRGVEWEDFEVKEAAGGVPRSVYATVSAFANTAGGTVVFGVKESKGRFEVVGVRDPDAIQNDFLTTLRTPEKFSHILDVKARWVRVGDAIVLAFQVPAVNRFDRPLRVRAGGGWQAYVRIGGGDHLCNPREEARFHRDAAFVSFDAEYVDGAGVGDLHADSLAWLRARVRPRDASLNLTGLSDQAWLERLGLMRGGLLNRAAVLLCGDFAAVSGVNPTPRVDFRLLNYDSTEPIPQHRWSDRELIDGNIVQAIRVLLERFDRLVPNPFALEADGFTRRAHGPHFPLLREALINLLVHQDHGDHRIARVLWYRDTVVFDNPGDSLVPIVDSLRGGATVSRNPLIQQIIRMCDLAEQAGMGMVTLHERWEALTGRAPIVRSDPAQKTYAIEFPWEQAISTEQVTPPVTPPVEALLRLLPCDGALGAKAIREGLGLKDRAHVRETYVQPALDAGLIEMTRPETPQSRLQQYRLTDAGRALLAARSTIAAAPDAP